MHVFLSLSRLGNGVVLRPRFLESLRNHHSVKLDELKVLLTWRRWVARCPNSRLGRPISVLGPHRHSKLCDIVISYCDKLWHKTKINTNMYKLTKMITYGEGSCMVRSRMVSDTCVTSALGPAESHIKTHKEHRSETAQSGNTTSSFLQWKFLQSTRKIT